MGDVAIKAKDHAIKDSNLTQEQIAYALKHTELGVPVADVCRQMELVTQGITRRNRHTTRARFSRASPTQATCDRSVARQGHVAGCAANNAGGMRPPARRPGFTRPNEQEFPSEMRPTPQTIPSRTFIIRSNFPCFTLNVNHTSTKSSKYRDWGAQQII